MKDENQTVIKGPEGVKGPEGPLMPQIILVPIETTASGKDYITHLILILVFLVGFIIGALTK
jgi:hypothetical protein